MRDEQPGRHPISEFRREANLAAQVFSRGSLATLLQIERNPGCSAGQRTHGLLKAGPDVRGSFGPVGNRTHRTNRTGGIPHFQQAGMVWVRNGYWGVHHRIYRPGYLKACRQGQRRTGNPRRVVSRGEDIHYSCHHQRNGSGCIHKKSGDPEGSPLVRTNQPLTASDDRTPRPQRW